MFSTPSSLLSFAARAERTVLSNLSNVSKVSCMKDLIGKLDEASNAMCRVVDLSDCLRQLHKQESWQQAASLSFDRINSLMHKLNLNAEILKVNRFLKQMLSNFYRSFQR